MKKIFDEAVNYFSTGGTYKLPNFCYGAGGTKIEAEFKFVGTVGNRTKLQFREVNGGWTVTLAPIQLIDVMHKKGEAKRERVTTTRRFLAQPRTRA